MIIEDWFPTQFFMDDMPEFLPETKACFTNIEERKSYQKPDHYNGATTYPQDVLLWDVPLMSFRSALDMKLAEMAVQQNINMEEYDVKVSSIWCNRMFLNSSHAVHAHPGAPFVGTYYVNCPEGSSSVRFHNPIAQLWLNSQMPTKNRSNYETVQFVPREGMLLLWNGWVPHDVMEHQVSEPRDSISFNAVITPRS